MSAFKLSAVEVRYVACLSGASNQVRIHDQSHALVRQTTVPCRPTR